MRKLLGGVMVLTMAQVACGAAPVEELSSSQGYRTASPAAVSSSGAADLYYQLQVLQEEVRELRGIVEEQGNELRQVKQRQIDDYQDLDSRIGGGGAAPAASNPPSESPALPPETTAENTSAANEALPDIGELVESEGEQASYDAAYELLKNRNIDQAVVSFKTHVQRYPNGPYAANAYYWLGEIYLLQNNLPEANLAFSRVVEGYPAHRKATDAMFKLGKVLHLQGQKDRAKALLQKVAATNTTAADLARAYLQENF